ncbi:uncharacterized protein [Haliotis asinina]|uniref:uncharacterized protein n=1 Tax=Haliotis asinina TaxID=109174 RepID=UPI0035318F21
MMSQSDSMAEDGGCGNIYSYGCRFSTSAATKTLLSTSESPPCIGEEPRLQSFLEVYDRIRCDPSERGQKKVKASVSGQKLGGSQGDGSIPYVFSHFDNIDKYMQRYRYYHTVGDAGHTGMDPHILGIQVASVASDDASNRSLLLNDLTEHGPSLSEFRTLLVSTRRHKTDLSSAKRNKSAPCSQNLKQSKRLYLTWEEYRSIHGPDTTRTPTQSPQHLQTCSSFVLDKDEQTTPKTVRKVSSAFPLRSSGASLSAETPKTRVKLKDSNTKGKENLDVEKSPVTMTPAAPDVKSRQVSPSTSVIPRAWSASASTTSRFKMTTVKERPRLCSKSVMKEILNNHAAHHSFTEAAHRSAAQRNHAHFVSSPHSHPEQCKTEKSSKRDTSQIEQFKKFSNNRSPNSRVGVMYKFSKVRRQQIHL